MAAPPPGAPLPPPRPFADAVFAPPRRANALFAVASAALLAWTFHVGRALKMDVSLPRDSYTRTLMSMGVSISRLSHGARGYLLYGPVVGALIEGGINPQEIDVPGKIDAAIARAAAVRFDPNRPDVAAEDWGDDKGYADYTTLAFWIFGLRIESLYVLFFLLLSASALVFALQFFREPCGLFPLTASLAAIYATMKIMPDSTVNSVVHDSRFLPALSLIAAMHVALLLAREGRPGRWALAGVAAQTALIVFAIDGRVSAQWQVVLLAAVWIGAAAIRSRLKFRPTLAALREKLAIAGIVAAGLVALHVYKDVAYADVYKTRGTQSHVFWHNVYMGFGAHPDAVARFDLNPTDATSYRHVHRWLQSHPDEARRFGADPATIQYPVFPQIGWRAYDRAVGAMTLDFLKTNPGYALACLAWYKPKYFLEELAWQFGLRKTFPAWVAVDDVVRPSKNRRLKPLEWIPLAAVLLPLAAGGAAAPRGTYRVHLAVGVAVALASLIPSGLVLPFYYELAAVFAAFTAALYLAIGAGLVAVLRLRTRRPNPEAAAC